MVKNEIKLKIDPKSPEGLNLRRTILDVLYRYCVGSKDSCQLQVEYDGEEDKIRIKNCI